MHILTTIALAATDGLRLGVCAASATITWLVLVSVMGMAYLILVMAVGRFLRLAGD